MGTFEMLISAPVKKWEILLGKTLPYVLLGMVDVILLLAFAVVVFDVPMKGPFWELCLAAFVFVCTTVSVGTVISTFAKNQQQAMMGGFMFLFPAMLLSGIMYPVQNMPAALIGVAYLDPLKYFVTLMRNIMLKGGDAAVFWQNLGALALLGLAALTLAVKRFRQSLN